MKSYINSVKQLMLFLLTLLFFISSSEAQSSKLTIACAANFRPTMNKLVSAFKQHSNHQIEIRISTGSSGSLATQILHGAPYDLFFSADTLFPQLLEQAGIGREKYAYASGELVLYSLNKSQTELSVWLNEMKDATVAIANPKLAPYGRTAASILQHQGVTPQRLVNGTSVLHAFQLVENGHAQYAFIAKSLLQTTFSGQWIAIPTHWYEPIEQHALLLTDNAHANAFFDYVKSDAAQLLISDSGYR
ncbi:molybdate ABC transporter substrate-binding protein [Pseudoalteromonas sp. T1lg23B]|uniref:molybdate ABC transporter substrate-binding protein n=1 Tax=Pseudoalteromonas sp. T1lg23B TaxID=2077097 RepID=UPI000CF67E48|nr:molybdate ABC transporter substrate-binding protein [Pseudoalteromonas sp. T1lg23B]